MANNQYYNKAQLADGTILIDLSNDTVTASDILQGKTAHSKSGEPITGNISSTAGPIYITPTRSQQRISGGQYLGGTVTIGAIPSNYYTLAEVFPVGSLYATESSTDNPSTILGFGTWTKYAPAAMTWDDAENTTWSSVTGVTSGIYVWKRTA